MCVEWVAASFSTLAAGLDLGLDPRPSFSTSALDLVLDPPLILVLDLGCVFQNPH
jgi:hypothetical protein